MDKDHREEAGIVDGVHLLVDHDSMENDLRHAKKDRRKTQPDDVGEDDRKHVVCPGDEHIGDDNALPIQWASIGPIPDGPKHVDRREAARPTVFFELMEHHGHVAHDHQLPQHADVVPKNGEDDSESDEDDSRDVVPVLAEEVHSALFSDLAVAALQHRNAATAACQLHHDRAGRS